MKRFLMLAAMLLGCAMGAQAQTYPTTDVPVIDPNNFVLFNTRTLSTMPFNLIVNVPSGYTWLSATLSATANSDGFTVTAECVADATFADTSSINLSLSQAVWIEYFQGILIGATTKNGFSPQTVATTPGVTNSLHIAVSGCSRLFIQFSAPTGTVTDTMRAQGQFNSFPMLPYAMGGPPQSISMGLISGLPVPISVNAGGQLVSATSIVPADAESNNADVFPAPGSAGFPLEVFPKFFNGATWDRQFTCPNRVNVLAVGAATVLAVTGVASQLIRVCSATYSNNSATATTIELIEGTGATCGTGSSDVTGDINLTANTTGGAVFTYVGGNTAAWRTTVTADSLCVVGSAAGAVDVTLVYAIY